MKVLIILTCKQKEKKVNLMFEIGVKFKKSRFVEKYLRGSANYYYKQDQNKLRAFAETCREKLDPYNNEMQKHSFLCKTLSFYSISIYHEQD